GSHLEKNIEKKKRQFILLLTEHRIWGHIFLPYIVVEESGFFRLTECLSPFPNIDTLSILTDEERHVVKIINEYTDRDLHKLFSREKNVKEFLEKVTTDRIEGFIRPYIEKRIYKCITVARNEDIPIYKRRHMSVTLHSEDRYFPAQENASPVFRFNRSKEETTYNLNLDCAGKRIDLLDSTTEILCMSPCIIIQEGIIYFVSDIDGSKLKPFLTRKHVIIPKKNETQYFKTFVLNAVNNFKVEGTGFEIILSVPRKEAVIEIDPGIRGIPVLILSYYYEGIKVTADETIQGLTILDHKGDSITFRKFGRDFQWELKCRQVLEETGLFSDDDKNFYLLAEDRKTYEIYPLVECINRNYTDLTEAGFSIVSRMDARFNLKPVEMEISSEMVNDWFDLKAVVIIGEFKIPFTRFRKNILENIREFMLPDGTIAILPESWFTRYKNVFELGKTSGDSLTIHKQHFSLLSDTLSGEHEVSEKLKKLLVPGQIPEVPIPSGLKCELRKYQAEGFYWLNFLQTANLGGCLADDMGLGKTIQTLALLQYNKENNTTPSSEQVQADLFSFIENRLTSLLIVPASLVYNWENEIERFVPGMRIYTYKGIQRKKSISYFPDYEIILSSYHTIRQDIDIISKFSFHYIILDESQVIKNPASQLYKAFTKLQSDHKLVLTGTPVENSLTDLWTQLNFVNPGLLGDLAFFKREFARPIERQGDDEKESDLRKIIQPFILRRTKEMVARDLPPVTEQTVYCDMTEEQEKLYEEEKSAVRNSILESISSSGLEKTAIIVLQGLMKLRQISNHPLMAFDDYSEGSGKFETVMQDISNVISEGHKILVFSSFVRHLEIFATELRNKRIGYEMLTGSSTNRERIVNSFIDDKEKKIFLISLKAGGVGLNLTAADYVFILDPWWNPASEMQALNRAHRIGQDKSVFVYRYITSNSIEEKIRRLQDRKSKLADSFISSNNPLKDFNLNEILDIIG
ncbi:MAG TPA: DEAD/DEAH box helicase, partial [Bacteroidales bacterium]|nr:DEAD/DEAH box helicase [Bacteroidales bacterium]